MIITHTKVKSSQIASIGHDAATNTLEVEFHGGTRYRYTDVPAEKYKAMLTAPSVGKYLHAEIKGKHTHTKV